VEEGRTDGRRTGRRAPVRWGEVRRVGGG
jgi:hypothetical protein